MTSRNSNGKSTATDKSNKKQTVGNAHADNNPDQLAKEADKERSRKPGSQSNSSGRHNNGRGGGK